MDQPESSSNDNESPNVVLLTSLARFLGRSKESSHGALAGRLLQCLCTRARDLLLPTAAVSAIPFGDLLSALSDLALGTEEGYVYVSFLSTFTIPYIYIYSIVYIQYIYLYLYLFFCSSLSHAENGFTVVLHI